MGFLEITRKDLLLLVRDRRALVVLLLLPMAFICILGLSTGRLLIPLGIPHHLRAAGVNFDALF